MDIEDNTARVGDASLISVVIPALNSGAVISAQLDALAAEAEHHCLEVVVADNGSTDDTVMIVRSYADRLDVKVVDASSRPRAAFARNVGATATVGEVLLFLDADDEICPGYVAAMCAALDRADIVGARLDVDALNGRARSLRDVPQVAALPLGLYPWSYSCALGVRRELFDAIGGFEEQLWNGEDVDFCWRAQMAGGRIDFASDAVVRYRVPTDAWALFRQGSNYGRGGSQVERRYSSMGVERPSPLRLVMQLATLSGRLAATCDRDRRGRLAFLIGRRVGMLRDRLRPLPISSVALDGRPSR